MLLTIIKNKPIRFTIIVSIGIYLILLLFWLLYDPTKNLVEQVPGMDKLTKNNGGINENIKIGDQFQKFADFSSDLKGTWPCFRGVNHDNIIQSSIKINENWEAKSPKVLWSMELGEGHAAPVIAEGLVYILDYDEKLKADMLRCFSLLDGKEIWRRWYKVRIKRNHGISRTTPAISGDFIVTIGPRCHVMCLNRKTGDLKWTLDLEMQYGTETPLWYTGQCPLIEGNTVVFAPGGKSLMIGVDLVSGKILWETPNPKNLKMSHSSIIPATFEDKKMYIYGAIGGICGVSADGQDLGKILWQITAWAPSVLAPSPVILPENKIYLTAGYGAGSAVIKIQKENNSFTAKIEQELKPSEGIACEQQTPIYVNGLLYSIMPKDGGLIKSQFVCYKPSDCSKLLWASGKTNRYGLGPYLLINNKFLILDDDGTLSLIRASKTGYEELSKKKIFEGQDAWGPMAYADGYLMLRDSKKMFCLDLR